MIKVTETFLPPFKEYAAYLERVWQTKWVTNRGELTLELEEKLKQFLQVKHLLAVSNGTIALQIAVKSLGLTGEIITTPFSYVATTSSIVWENCQPVFVDIDENYLTIDETKIEAAISRRTSAILATHVYGNPCAVEAIEAIADQHNLRVIYDAAHCFGVNYKGESILHRGDISTLSFHATKLFHTGEGGGIVCRDEKLAAQIFQHHNFGHKGEEDFYGLGVNGKMSELNAAMGLAMLPHLPAIYTKRRAISEIYDERLSSEKLRRLRFRAESSRNYAYYPVIFNDEASLLQTQKRLNQAQIFPRRYFYPSLNCLPYVKYQTVPVAEDISRRILCLPIYAGLAAHDAEVLCRITNSSLL